MVPIASSLNINAGKIFAKILGDKKVLWKNWKIKGFFYFLRLFLIEKIREIKNPGDKKLQGYKI